MMLEIRPGVGIQEEEITFTTDPASGPGGQNVNKVSTRVTAWFHVANSPSLSPPDKELLQERLATRINRDGFLRVTSQRHRTQLANKQAARLRMLELMAQALVRQPPRHATRPTRASQERRLQHKRKRSTTKQLRSGKPRLEE